MCHEDYGGGFPRVKSRWKDEEEGGREGTAFSHYRGKERRGWLSRSRQLSRCLHTAKVQTSTGFIQRITSRTGSRSRNISVVKLSSMS